MKKTMMTMLGVALLMSSCGTYTAEGAYVGAQFGTILGSAVGGISGGWRGSDIGAVVGMAGGAVVGAAIGQAADQKAEERAEVYRRERMERMERRAERQQEPYGAIDSDDSGFDAAGGGDDRVDFGISGPSGEAPSVSAPKEVPSVSAPNDGSSVSVEDLQNHRPQIELCNIRIVGNSQSGVLRAGEQCRVVFEIMNRTRHTLMDIQPIVEELSGNKHLHISPNLHIESIAPGTGVRYTATIKADKRLKDGQAVLRIAVAHHNREQESQTQQFTLQTLKH